MGDVHSFRIGLWRWWIWQKIKGGDMLIFRMEILKILGGKVRAAKCDLKTRENCESDEIQVLEKWSKRPVTDIEAEISSLTKKSEGTLKTGEREKIMPVLGMLKKIVKALKKGTEL